MAEVKADYNNIYTYFTDVSVSLLLGNIGTTETHNGTLNLILTKNQDLTDAWTTGDAGADVAAEIAAVKAAPPGHEAGQAAYILDQFIGNYMTGKGTDFTAEFSQAVGATILQLVAANYGELNNIGGSSSGQASVDSSTANSYNSIVSSTGSNAEQILQNEGKTEGSVVQGDAGTMQTIASCADAMQGSLGNVASLLQQGYS